MEGTDISTDIKRVFYPSWTAFVDLGLKASLFIVPFSAWVFYTGTESLSFAIINALIGLLFTIPLLIYKVLVIRSIKIYTDDKGVWMYKGVFAWSKGVSGVKWRDLDSATFTPDLMGWLLKSYHIRVGHRFTKSSELIIKHVHHGDEAVKHINHLHAENIRKEKE